MQESSNLLTISQAAKYLSVSKDTLRRWEKRKILKPFRSPTGWRYYNKKQLDYVYTKKPEFNSSPDPSRSKKIKSDIEVKTNLRDKKHKENFQINLKDESKYNSFLTYFFVFILFLTLSILLFYLYQVYFV